MKLMEIYNLLMEITAEQAWEQVYSDETKYPGLTRELFNALNALYPKSDAVFNKAYFSWLWKLHTSGKLKSEDYYKAAEYLALFDRFKKEIDPENRDLGRLNTLPELYDIVEPFVGKKSNRDVEAEIRNEIELVYNANGWRVYIPKTERASCKLGRGTQWCTAATEGDNYFDDYNDEGPLYVMINDTGDKYQLHLQSAQLMDARDSPVDPFVFFDNDYGQYDGGVLYDFFIKRDTEAFTKYLLDTISNESGRVYYSELLYNTLNNATPDTYPNLDDLLSKIRRNSDDESMVELAFDMESDPDYIYDEEVARLFDIEIEPERLDDIIEHLIYIGYKFSDDSGLKYLESYNEFSSLMNSMGYRNWRGMVFNYNGRQLTIDRVDFERLRDGNPNFIHVTLEADRTGNNYVSRNETGYVTLDGLKNMLTVGSLF